MGSPGGPESQTLGSSGHLHILTGLSQQGSVYRNSQSGRLQTGGRHKAAHPSCCVRELGRVSCVVDWQPL